MFNPVPPKADHAVLEDAILKFWKEHHIPAKANRPRVGSKPFVLVEYPLAANEKPGMAEVTGWAYKDLYLRYKAMCGYGVVRRFGWNMHGLAVELEIEKRLGLKNKQQIEAFGIDRFNEKCRRSVFDYLQDWERLIERMAYWVDLTDAYVTSTPEYIESVWWCLKELWEKDMLSQRVEVVPYCPRCGTPLAEQEVQRGCRPAEVTAVYVRLPLVDEPGTSLLVWTAAPWKLTGNVAVALHPNQEYVTVERWMPEGGKERLILARARLKDVLGGDDSIDVVSAYKGKKFKGKRYRALYTFLLPNKPAHGVILSNLVNVEEGTGLQQLAPAFSAQDMRIAQENDLPMLATVQSDGAFIPEVRPYRGSLVWEAEPSLIEELQRRGLILRSETIQSNPPFCPYCSTPVLEYAHNTWFLDLGAQAQQMSESARRIAWHPAQWREERFLPVLENKLWVIGRERYWGTPLPVWSDADGNHLCVGSLAELAKLSGCKVEQLDPHLPAIDEVTFPNPKTGKTMHRTPDLVDAWFDAGCMPTAQYHYPFENRALVEQHLPAGLVCENMDQSLPFLYTLLAANLPHLGKDVYKHVLCLGKFLQPDGERIDPREALDQHGIDQFRWGLYVSAEPWQEHHLLDQTASQSVDDFYTHLWKAYAFFIHIASPSGWTPPDVVFSKAGVLLPGANDNPLDRWLRSLLHTLIRQTTEAYEQYDIRAAAHLVQDFVEKLVGWYLSRSHRRFWNPASAADRQNAVLALYETLVALSKLLAPAMPFLAEEIYQNLVRGNNPAAPESVHLADWPLAQDVLVDDGLIQDMVLVMRLAELGQSARQKTTVKGYQPLGEAAFTVKDSEERRVVETYGYLLAEALNVKHVSAVDASDKASDAPLTPQSGLIIVSDEHYLTAIATDLSPELVQEGLARAFIQHVQALRDAPALSLPAARLSLQYQASPSLAQALEAYRELVMSETQVVDVRAIAEDLAGLEQVEADGETRVSFTIGEDRLTVVLTPIG